MSVTDLKESSDAKNSPSWSFISDDSRFRKLIEKSTEGITLFNRQLDIIYRSPSAEKILGWTDDDRTLRPAQTLYHPDDKPLVDDALNELLTGNREHISIELRAQHSNGRYIWLDCIFTNLLDDPDVGAIVCNFRDISERKHREEELRNLVRELRDYKYALDQSAIVAFTDADGTIEYVNDKFCEVSQYGREELLGKTHRLVNSGYHDNTFFAGLWDTIKGGKVWRGEVRNQNKDGDFVWADTTIVPFMDKDGHPYRFVAIRADITKSRQAFEKIAENERFIKAITDNLPVMIAYWDAGLRCRFANKPYCSWFDKTAEEMDGIDKRELLSDEESGWHENYIQRVLSGERQSFERILNRAGKKIYTHTQYLPDMDGQRVKGFYSLIYDTSEIKAAEAIAERNRRMVEETLRNQNAILDALPLSIGLLSESGEIIAVNELWRKLMAENNNLKADFGMGLPYTTVAKKISAIDDNCKAELDAGIRAVLNKEVSRYSQEYPFSMPSRHGWGQTIVVPLHGTEKKGALVANMDISDRKRAELRLAASEQRYRQIVETAQEGIWVLDEDMRTIFVNQKMCDILEYPAEEIVGRYTYEFKESPEIEKTLERLEKRKRGITDPPHETSFFTKTGRRVVCIVSPTGIFDDDGRFKGTLTMITDITQRKLHEESLRISEANLSAIIENTPDLVYSLNRKLLFTTYNQQFKNTIKQVYGLDVESHGSVKEMLAKLGPGMYDKWMGIYRKALAGEAQQFVNEYDFGGSKVYLSYSVNPIRESGKVIGLSCFSRDITRQRTDQLVIQQSESNLRTIIENTELCIILYDKAFHIVSFNSNADKLIWRLLGKKLKEGEPGLDFFPDDRIEAINEVLDRIKNSGSVFYENKYTMPDATYAWFEVHWVCLTDAEGENNGYLLTYKDTTERKDAEIERNQLNAELLQRNNDLKLLESVVTNSTDGVMITDTGGPGDFDPKITYVNKAFTTMTGYGQEEVIGQSPLLLVGPKSDKKVLKQMKSTLLKWQTSDFNLLKYKKNGETIWVDFSLFPIANEKGDYTHWIALERDVTKSKNSELQKSLWIAIMQEFNEQNSLKTALHNTLGIVCDYGNFGLAELWLVSNDKKHIDLSAAFARTAKAKKFLSATSGVESFKKAEGFPGITWDSGEVQLWKSSPGNASFFRADDARHAGFKRIYSIPLFYNSEAIGALLLMLDRDEAPAMGLATMFDDFSVKFGAEIKRKQIEDELNQIFNFSPDILCIASKDGYFKKVNPAMCSMLEYSEQELLSRPILDFVYPEDKARTIEELLKVGDSYRTFYFENRYVTRSGKTLWFAWTSSPATTDGLLSAAGKNITEKKQLEELLDRASRTARFGVWEFDLDKNDLHWSEPMKEIFETGPDFQPDVKGRTESFLLEEDRSRVDSLIAAVKRSGETAKTEVRIKTAKGNIKWVNAIYEVEAVNGVCHRLFGTVQDIDDRKRAQLALNDALEERNSILESIGDAFFAIDQNNIITYWNNTAEKVFARKREDLLNRNFWEIFPHLAGHDFYKNYRHAADNHETVHFELLYPESATWYEVSIYASDKGQSVYFRDITQRKETLQQLNRLNEALQLHARELAVSNAELEQFAYVASHDLQEPLRMVTSFLTQIEKKYGQVIDDKGKQYIHFAVDGAKRMRQIILDLLEYSRVGKSDGRPEAINLDEMLHEISNLFRHDIEGGAQIKFAGLPVIVSYRTPLWQILQNLIGNGLKYHRKDVKPVVTINCTVDKQQITFCVEDNGIGIDKQYFEKIFVIFQRLHNRDEYSGTGMGLSITKKIIENLGGRIWVDSEPGKGSRFYFSISKYEEHEAHKNIAG